jgi:hypothetical protein
MPRDVERLRAEIVLEVRAHTLHELPLILVEEAELNRPAPTALPAMSRRLRPSCFWKPPNAPCAYLSNAALGSNVLHLLA